MAQYIDDVYLFNCESHKWEFHKTFRNKFIGIKEIKKLIMSGNDVVIQESKNGKIQIAFFVKDWYYYCSLHLPDYDDLINITFKKRVDSLSHSSEVSS